MSNKELIKFIRGAQECYEAGVDTDDISDALQQAADALEAMEWKPIDGAVKNGDSILAFRRSVPDEPFKASWFKYNGLNAWRDSEGEPYSDITDYMPLPSPPEEE